MVKLQHHWPGYVSTTAQRRQNSVLSMRIVRSREMNSKVHVTKSSAQPRFRHWLTDMISELQNRTEPAQSNDLSHVYIQHSYYFHSASTQRLGWLCLPPSMRYSEQVWNGLPSDVTSASSLAVFKNRLKTYLFRRCYETIWLWMTLSFPSNFIPSRTVVLVSLFMPL